MAQYEVMVDTLGANPTFSKGDIIEDSGEMKAPYDFPWLLRTGAIKPAADRVAARPLPTVESEQFVAPVVPAQDEMRPAGTGEGSTGHHPMMNLDVLDADQQAALGKAGFGSAEAIRAASDEDLLKVEGVGPATLRKLRESTQA
jgi:hypothetical protein